MTGIGPDISEVLDELGTRVHVIKHDGSDPIVEYIDYEVSIQANSPFLTQFMLDCTLTYDTQARPGDIIRFLDNNQDHLLVVANKTRFENAPVTYEGILYRCNVTGTLKRRVEVRDANYNLTTDWSGEVANEPALLTGMVDNFGFDQEVYGEFTREENNLHISNEVNAIVGDRFELDTGEKFEITMIAPRRLNNVSICRVTIDNRE